MACKICEKRRAQRFCPPVGGDICARCCGEGREATIACPLDCVHLQAARRHERTEPVHPDEFPNRDIRVTDRFLREHDALLVALGRAVLGAALETEGAVDNDMRDALEALVRTWRTLESGVLYESRPDNRVAAQVFQHVQDGIAEFREREIQELGMVRTRDADVLVVLAFMQRLELDRNNGRRRGRAFVDLLHRHFTPAGGAAPVATGSLIVP
ncbi:MAG: hypothetical protein ACRD96_01370 [Bryobacteraceae bacterium]